MADDDEITPLRPEDRRQAELLKAAEQRAGAAKEVEARLLSELDRTPTPLEKEEARLRADEHTRGGTVFFRDERSLTNAATEALDKKTSQQEAAQVAAQEQAQPERAVAPAEQQKHQLEPDLHALAASHARRHDVADYSQLPQVQAAEKPIVQEFHATAKEVTEHKPTPPNNSNESGAPRPSPPPSSLSSQAVSPDRPMTGDEILADPSRHAKQQVEQRARMPDEATPADASPATQRRSASPDSREQAKASDLTRKQQMQIALQRFTRDGDRANARENDGSRGDASGRSKGR